MLRQDPSAFETGTMVINIECYTTMNLVMYNYEIMSIQKPNGAHGTIMKSQEIWKVLFKYGKAPHIR